MAKPQQWAQEKRTLGTTAGGSTYMLTLPKAWIEHFNFKKGDELTLSHIGSGIYLSLNQQQPASPTSTKLAISDSLRGEVLVRTLISRYIAGFNVIEVTGTISIEQRNGIRNTVQRLIGAEILQETSEFLLIHVLRDPQVLSVSQLLDYIRDNVTNMLRDAPISLLQNDLEKALGVIQRDERVDRFFLLLSRRLYAALQNPLAEVEHQISRVDFFNTHNVSRQLERVADHAVKIAQAAQTLLEAGHTFPKELAPLLEQAQERLQVLISQVMDAFENLDGERAHLVLEELPQIERLVIDFDQKLLNLEGPLLAHQLSIVADSINRVKDYTGNVAELALNAEALCGV